MDIITICHEHFQEPPRLVVQAPGRVNLLGEHVDYNMGPVLPAAIDRMIDLAAIPIFEPNLDSRYIYLYANDLDQTTAFSLDHLHEKVDLSGDPLPKWAYYPAGVAWILLQAGYPVHGVKVAYSSNIPIGAGLSSSAAVEVAFAVLWQALGGWQADRLELARLCQQAENEYVGVACGLMDQFASACGVEGHALYFDTRSLAWEPAPLPYGSSLVIADSSVRRNLTESGYNNRRAACETAVSILRKFLPHVQSLRDVKTTEFAAYACYLPQVVRMRAEHVIREIHRVYAARQALQKQDKRAIGKLMYAGHQSLRDLYEVSTPELDQLVELSRCLPGIIGARLTGAGFGGCTVNLVETSQAEFFIDQLSAEYTKASGLKAQIFKCQASAGAYYRWL